MSPGPVQPESRIRHAARLPFCATLAPFAVRRGRRFPVSHRGAGIVGLRFRAPGRGAIRTGFAEAERSRFRSLLALAAGSSYDGEREAALAAARRLAARHGMSLAEAARGGEPEPLREESPFERMRRARAAARAHAFRESERRADEDRARFRAAWEDALRRGLDREEEPPPQRRAGQGFVWRSRRRMEPVQHATVLLNETRLPFSEIAEITGLDRYDVVGLKLKLRDVV